MGGQRPTAAGDAPDRHRTDASTWIVAAIVGGAGLFYIFLGGLSAPPTAVLIAMACYLLALVEMVRRLRADRPLALVVPLAVVMVWTVVLVIALMFGIWSP